MLLSYKKFWSVAGRSFQGWNARFDLHPCQILSQIWCSNPSGACGILAWACLICLSGWTGIRSEWAEVPVIPSTVKGVAGNWPSAVLWLPFHAQCSLLSAQFCVSVSKCNLHCLSWWETVQVCPLALAMNYPFFRVEIIQSKNVHNKYQDYVNLKIFYSVFLYCARKISALSKTIAWGAI